MKYVFRGENILQDQLLCRTIYKIILHPLTAQCFLILIYVSVSDKLQKIQSHSKSDLCGQRAGFRGFFSGNPAPVQVVFLILAQNPLLVKWTVDGGKMSKSSEEKNSRTQERIAAALERIAVTLERIAISFEYGSRLMEVEPIESGNQYPDDKDAEKRRHPRKPCSIMVDYATQDRAFKDYIRDISKGGVFIETSNFFDLGQEFIMTFSVPSQSKPFKFIGEVVRTDKRGVGVRFKKNVSTEDR